jgi:hypothetical protein
MSAADALNFNVILILYSFNIFLFRDDEHIKSVERFFE